MKIYINGRFLAEKVTGVQRYAIEVIKKIDELIKERKINMNYQFILLIPKICPRIELENIEVRRVCLLDSNIGEQIFLLFWTRDGFLLNLCNRAPLLKKNQALVIHDAALVTTSSRFYRSTSYIWTIFYFVFGHTLKNIITVSDFSKNEISKYFHIPSEKISVVYEGCDHILDISCDRNVLKKLQLESRGFVLAVGGTKNKNFSLLVEAIRIYLKTKIKIIIAGKIEKEFLETIKSVDCVECIGYVTDEELVALYRNAGCFIFPSIYEGFGIPPLEAMALGCPVIVSRAASLPEIYGDSAIYCDPYNAKDLADKIELVLNNEKLICELKNKGEKRAMKYLWKNTAEGILDLLIKQLEGDKKEKLM